MAPLHQGLSGAAETAQKGRSEMGHGGERGKREQFSGEGNFYPQQVTEAPFLVSEEGLLIDC